MIFNLTSVVIALCAIVYCAGETMPLPWNRVLTATDPPMSGNDVVIAQNLLLRDKSVSSFVVNGAYDKSTAAAVTAFQTAHDLIVSGDLDSVSAQKLLDLYSYDGIQDSGFTAKSLGYKYKVSVPVHLNRSIETIGTLYDDSNNVLLTFAVRTHGLRDDGVNYGWPDFGSSPPDFGLNQFSSSGDTVTGVIEIDLNSPEPNPQVYGPWPVNRLIRGLQGNAAWLLPNIRDGMLIHTGNWTTASQVWDPTMPMPNSSGCLHAHPEDVERIYKALVAIGVQVNENPFSGKNYPYKPQGIAVVYQLTSDLNA